MKQGCNLQFHMHAFEYLVSIIVRALYVHRTDRRAIAMIFIRPSVCLGRACIVIIRCTLAQIEVYDWIFQCYFWALWHQSMSTPTPDYRFFQFHLDERWGNNLTLNRSKSVEIVFVDKWRRQKLSPPLVLPDMERITSLKILGVTFTNRLLMGEQCSIHHQRIRITTVRTESAPSTWNAWNCTSGGLPG